MIGTKELIRTVMAIDLPAALASLAFMASNNLETFGTPQLTFFLLYYITYSLGRSALPSTWTQDSRVLRGE